jgi:hypothetical protein
MVIFPVCLVENFEVAYLTVVSLPYTPHEQP